VNLIAELVRRTAGTDLVSYVNERILRPLGIIDPKWLRDGVGNPYVMAGLHLTAGELARIGQLILRDGCPDRGPRPAQAG